MVTPKYSIFENLLNSKEFTIAYKDAQSFDVGSTSDTEKRALNQVCGVEVVFPNSESDLYQMARSILLLLHSWDDYSGEFYIRDLELPMSKLRTYKGILKTIKQPNMSFIEKEFLLRPNESYFASVISLDTISSDLFSKYFANSSMNFVLLRKGKPAISNRNLDAIMKGHYYQRFGLNYLRLVLDQCVHEKHILLRAGGDGGKTFWSAQFFVPADAIKVFAFNLDRFLSNLASGQIDHIS